MDIISFAKASAAGRDIQLKTINGNDLKGTGNIAITTYQAFPQAWAEYTTSSKTTKQFCDVVDADETAVIGMGYFGGAQFSDKPAGLSNFDIVVEILEGPNSSKAIHLVGTSSSVYPYRWEYTYWSHGSVSGWRGVQPEITINPTLAGGETNITALQFGDTKYTVGKLYRHNISVDGHVISVILPFSDSVENHKSSLTYGAVGTLLTGGTTPHGVGTVCWNVDEWEIYDASGTETAWKATCGDTITELA